MCLVAVTAISLLAGCSSGSSSSSGNSQSGNDQQESQTEATSGTTAVTGNEADTSAVGETTGSQNEADSTATAGSTAQEDSQEVTDTVFDSGKVLVVYYSATGNTEEVANMIADTTGGDLFELEPAESYTDEDLNYNDENSRVSQEYANEDQRDVELVSTTVDDWNSYDTVFIGYPIWWGIAAWPMDTFVEANDFTGKTVILFCTSASSGIGDSGSLLAEMAGTGDWLEDGLQVYKASDVRTFRQRLEDIFAGKAAHMAMAERKLAEEHSLLQTGIKLKNLYQTNEGSFL